jgi:hypothetical protein
MLFTKSYLPPASLAMRSTTILSGLVAALFLALAAGCGGGSGATVTGTVTFNGQPVESGTISFFPEDGKSAPAGGEVHNGSFSVKNVSPGKNRVAVSSHGGKGPENMDDAIKAAKQGPAKDVIMPKDDGNNQVVDVTSGGPPLELKIRTAVSSGGTRPK